MKPPAQVPVETNHSLSCVRISAFGIRSRSVARTIALRPWDFARLTFAALICVPLAGCFGFLKPAASSARHFVLTPIAAPATPPSGHSLSVGVAQVKIPTYLFDSSLAVRNGNNEISYESSLLWAERLDNGIQRVLASNLSALLPSDSVRISAWTRQDVAAELYVSVTQFDLDDKGQGVLAARWRIAAPGGDKILKTGTSQFTRKGPAPDTDPSGAVGTLSELVGDLSRALAQAIKEVAATNGE
jgi:uncharacterized lipoprotein YmbA